VSCSSTHDQRLAGLGVAAGPLEVRNLLQLLLDAVGHLPVHLFGSGPRPERAHHHAAEGEVRILAPAEIEVGERAGDRHHEQEEQGQLRLPDGGR